MKTQYDIIHLLVKGLGRKLTEQEIKLIYKLDDEDNKLLLSLFEELIKKAH